MNIIEFIQHPEMLNDRSLSLAQKTALKSVYGLPLTDDELKMFFKITGLKEYREGKEWSESSFILGRRAGKSDKIASSIALFEACSRDHRLTIGQVAVVMIIASEKKRQAKIVFNYIEGKLKASPILKKMIVNITQETISLNNGVEIWIYPCSIGRVRGTSLLAFIGDETAHWKIEGKDVDQDVLDSVRPGLDFPHSKMIKISTPYAKKGEIWQDYKQFYGKKNDDVLVFQGSTKLFNPSFSDRKLERMKRRKPLIYRTEHEAFFRTDISGMFDPSIIDKAVNFDRPLELPFREEIDYKSFCDVSGGGGKDAYSISIAHIENGKVIIDVIRSRQPPFNPDQVTAQYCELLKSYKIHSVSGDKFSGDWSSNCFRKYGIFYERSIKTKSELYIESEAVFNTGRVEIPNKELAVNQLKSLVRKTRSGGKDSVDADSSEDEANVICGSIWQLLSLQFEQPLEPSLGLLESAENDQDRSKRKTREWLIGSERRKTKKQKTQIDYEQLEHEIMDGLEDEIEDKKDTKDDIEFKHGW